MQLDDVYNGRDNKYYNSTNNQKSYKSPAICGLKESLSDSIDNFSSLNIDENIKLSH